MTMLLPRHFVEKPWGRTDLPSEFGADRRRIGEVWYDRPGRPLPVLVKWLFTSDRLSIQVHPDDAQARARSLPSGKEECWIVTHAEPGATLGIGTRHALSGDELREASLSGEIVGLIDWKPVKAGDWFYIPAGTVHAIGAGVTLVEVQQNADVTFRLHDYGRPRELHLDDGVAVSTAVPYRGRCGSLSATGADVPFAKGPNFTVGRVETAGDSRILDRMSLFVPLDGEITGGGLRAQTGDVLLSPPGSEFAVPHGAQCLQVIIAA